MYFWTYGLRKTWLGKCLIGPVSEDPSTRNMVNGPKHCWNLNDRTFTVFIDSCERKSGQKILPEWYTKSYDFLLSHWLLMTSILFLTEAIYCNMFRFNYLRNEKFFSIFLSIFWIYMQFWTFSKKRWPPEIMYFWTYGLGKARLDKCLKSLVSGDPSTTNMVNWPKHCWNLNDSTFTIFIYPCERNSVGNSLS